MKRFKIYSERTLIERFETLQQCIDFLLNQDLGLSSYMVEDVIDDIEVSADDILRSYADGERYEDLQGF